MRKHNVCVMVTVWLCACVLCELAGADAAAERILFCSSVRWHGLMGLIETKTAEREFRLTVEMRDDFNELPKQWKIHPFIRLNGSNTLTHICAGVQRLCATSTSIQNVCESRFGLK